MPPFPCELRSSRCVNYNSRRVFCQYLFYLFVDNVYFLVYNDFRERGEFMKINDRLLAIRKKVGLNQEAFGKRIGVTRSAICNYENGTRPINEQVILSVCREFGANVEWLRDELGEMMVAAPSDELVALADKYHLRHKEFVLIEKLVTMSEKERDGIFRFMADVVAGATGQGADPDAYVTSKGSGPSGLSRERIHQMLDEHIDAEKELEEKSPASSSGESGAMTGTG